MNKVVSEIDYDKEPVSPASDLPKESTATGPDTGPDAGPDTKPDAEPDAVTETEIGDIEQDTLSETVSDELPNSSQTFTHAEIAVLQRMLGEGERPLARRHDLVELHNRIVKLLTTVNEGLGDMLSTKTRNDRAALSQRIDGLEESVNRLEGALRIEFEPVLKRVVEDALAAKTGVADRRGLRLLSVLALITAGVAAGAYFDTHVTAFWEGTVSAAETVVEKSDAE